MNIFATEMLNFIRKFYLLHELLISKYWRQNISVSNIASHTACSQALRLPAHRAPETVHLLTHENQTSSLQLCGQTTVLTLIQSTTRFGGSCRIVCTAARFMTSNSWSRAWSKSGNISTRWSSIKRSGSGIHVLELAFHSVHTVDILNTDFRCAEVLPFALTHIWHSITPVPMLLSDLTKLAVSVADVDRFCWNLVPCLQFNLSVLV